MRDLHMHTVFSDGKNTPEEMVAAAIEKGLDTVGISDHSHASSDPCGMKLEDREAYRREIARLKTVYGDRIRVLCGLERDFYSDDFDDYDYVIGSVHSIRMPDGYDLCVDWEADRLQRDVDRYFGGDWYGLAEAYYEVEARVAEVTRCDIIGHFDLVTKFNEQGGFFDENHPRYVQAWQRAADRLLAAGKPFEINTGAISRGYRTGPYPSPAMREYILRQGGSLLLSSDAHRKEDIAFQFDRWQIETSSSFSEKHGWLPPIRNTDGFLP